MNRVSINKIFISHSAKDIKIIESFVEHILRLGLDISSERIFCSSMEGHGVRSGRYIPDILRQEIHQSSIALLFISKNYKSSEVCLNELGAAWVTLEKENVIPFLLPDIDFENVGFLDFGRLGLRVNEKGDILRLIQDNKEQLNPSFHLEKLHTHIEKFLETVNSSYKAIISGKEIQLSEESTEWKQCFEDNLYPFDDIMRQTIPAFHDGVYEIADTQTQNKILDKLSKSSFLKTLWYRKAAGDFYVERLNKLANGNWLVSGFGWEIKISSMWISKNIEMPYEFILLRSEVQPPYKINSDVGGESFNVGILNDGTIVSENERLSGYAIINSETIDVDSFRVQPRVRDRNAHWVFFVTDYHKAGYNADETIEFCRKLDSGEVEVSAENIFKFLRPLRSHPTVIRWR